MGNRETDRVARRVEKVIAYLNSPVGLAATVANQRRGYDVRKNYLAAIQTVTRLVKYEEITAVYEAIGPALNRRIAERATA
jgi:hypothetical protein